MKSTMPFLCYPLMLCMLACETEPLDPAVLHPAPPGSAEIVPDSGENDVHLTGIASGNCGIGVVAPFQWPDLSSSLPVAFDLSADMPPVGSQGSYASCVGWATGYYLKSYQEKKQFGYAYDTYDQVMSPAFVYNLSKLPGDCNVGSCIESALQLLTEKGVPTWQAFPYGGSCGLQPTSGIIASASTHKIRAYFALTPFVTAGDTTLTKTIKAVLASEKPVVIGLQVDRQFQLALPRQADGTYVCKNSDLSRTVGGHALLVTGYDDGLQAFKVVNSWGTSWGNAGYGWISYDFFKATDEPGYQPGLMAAYYTDDVF